MGRDDMPELIGLLAPREIPPHSAVEQAFPKCQALVQSAAPQVIVLIDAEWRPRAFSVGRSALSADPEGHYAASGAPDLAGALIETALDYGLPAYGEEAPLTAGAAEILRRLVPQGDIPVLPLGVPTASPSLLQEFGEAIRATARELRVQALPIVVGPIAQDLQTLHAGRDNPAVAQFGRLVLERLAQGGGEQLFDIDGALWVAAHPETDLGHLALLLGVTTPDAQAEVLAADERPGLFAALVAFHPPAPMQMPGPGLWPDSQRMQS